VVVVVVCSRACLSVFDMRLPLLLLITGFSGATVVFSMLGKSLICIAYSVVYVFGNEIFPTEVRNVGVGTAIMGSHVTSMTAAYVGGPMVSQMMAYSFVSLRQFLENHAVEF